MTAEGLVFVLFATITLGSAGVVVLARSLIYSAFALLFTFFGVAGLYLMLGADFLAATQLLVYVGGILVLTLFAVMLTHRISDVNVSNRAVGGGAGLIVVGVVLVWMLQVARRAVWVVKAPAAAAPTTYGIGHAFLTDFVLPFEVASIVLLAALVGAIVVSRKEVKA